MPIVGQVGNTKIYIRFDEHNPPHVHLVNAEQKCLVYIKTLRFEGKPVKNMEEVLIWIASQEEYLMKKWEEFTGQN